MKKTVGLKHKLPNILEIIDQTYEKDFTFTIDGHEYKINKIIADYISPAVLNTHKIDPTYDEFVLKTKGKGDFERFLQLYKTEEIEIQKSEVGFFLELCKALKIDSIELIDKDPHEITIKNVFSQIKYHEKYEEFFSQYLQDEIDFLAENFIKLNDEQKNKMKKFSQNTLIRIFNSTKFQISDEDEFFSFINKLYIENHDNSILYGSVEFSYVSPKLIFEFLDMFKFEDINEDIWMSLCSIIKNDLKDENKKKKKLKHDNFNRIHDKIESKGLKFKFENDTDFDGILNYLQNKYKESFKIEAASHKSNSLNHKVENIVNYKNDDYFYYSDHSKDNWIEIDFKNHSVTPTEYTIKSAHWPKGGDHLKSWRLEGSTDGETWETIDEVKNSEILNNKNAIHTFKIKKNISNKFKQIKLVLKGENWKNKYFLSIDSFELYGTLY